MITNIIAPTATGAHLWIGNGWGNWSIVNLGRVCSVMMMSDDDVKKEAKLNFENFTRQNASPAKSPTTSPSPS